MTSPLILPRSSHAEQGWIASEGVLVVLGLACGYAAVLVASLLAACGFLAMVAGMLASPLSPTCNDNTYEYFFVSKMISHAVLGALRVDGVGMAPQRPVRLLLRGDARDQKNCPTRSC